MSEPGATVPLAVKLGWTAVCLICLPLTAYHYGAPNLLWFSNLATVFLLVSLWTAHPLPASAMAVGVLLPEVGWVVDYLAGLALGAPPAGFTTYMFRADIPYAARVASLFHLALPPLLLWTVHRLGYDRRGLAVQVGLALVLLPLLQLTTAPWRNINWVHGPVSPQEAVPPLAWLGILVLGHVLVVYLPTHLLLRRLVRSPGSGRAS